MNTLQDLKSTLSSKIVEASDFLKGFQLHENEVAFLGIGSMSAPMSTHLLNAGVKVYLWNTAIEKTASPIQGELVVHANKIEDTITKPHVVFVMLYDYKAITEALLTDSVLKLLHGKLIIVMTRLDVSESQELAAKMKSVGAEYVEVAVIGTPAQAEAAQLRMLVGCSDVQFSNWKSFLSLFGFPYYIGAPPRATSMKLAFNFMLAAQNAAFATALGFVQRSDLSYDSFMEILRTGTSHSQYFDSKLQSYLGRDYSDHNHTNADMSKDMINMVQESRRIGLDSKMSDLLLAQLQKASESVGEGRDFASVYDTINPPATQKM